MKEIMAEITLAARRRIAKEWINLPMAEQILFRSTWAKAGVSCDVCGAIGYYREICTNGCVAKIVVESSSADSSDSEQSCDRDVIVLKNVPPKNDTNEKKNHVALGMLWGSLGYGDKEGSSIGTISGGKIQN